ncbi:hypothetical protein AB5I41_23630 [Sphingomonas sp. MMS24-JH45]
MTAWGVCSPPATPTAPGSSTSYAYDQLGQRLRHAQAGRAEGDAETTDYDIQGRVVATRAFGGDTTAVAYGWEGAISAGTGVTGRWRETTTYVNGKTQVKVADTYGRGTSRTDMGGAVTTTTYDQAGRVATVTGIELQKFGWYNSGLLARQTATWARAAPSARSPPSATMPTATALSRRWRATASNGGMRPPPTTRSGA